MEKRVPGVALIIAGGKGTRLRPITYRIPKPLVKVNRKAILEHLINELNRNGINRIYISIGHKAEQITDYLKRHKPDGVKLSYVYEPEPLGTGGAIKLGLSKIRRSYRGDVFVTNGDELFRFDIADMYAKHRANRAALTIAVKRVDDVRNYGVIVVRHGCIEKFVEKPDPQNAPSDMISIGKYIFSGSIYGRLPKAHAFSIERDFFQKSTKSLKMCAYVSDGPWYPTDNLERLAKARAEWNF